MKISLEMAMTSSCFVWAVVMLWFAITSNESAVPYIPSNAFQEDTRCHTIPFLMPIKRDGCLKQKIQNNICAGSCLSVFIPQYGEKPLETCNLCQAKELVNVTVSLICMGKDRFYKVREEIEVVKSCGCEMKPHPCKRV